MYIYIYIYIYIGGGYVCVRVCVGMCVYMCAFLVLCVAGSSVPHQRARHLKEMRHLKIFDLKYNYTTPNLQRKRTA